MSYSITVNVTPTGAAAAAATTTTTTTTTTTATSSSTESKNLTEKLKISFEEYVELNTCLFNWADSYDDKDWTRLAGIIAPTLKVDYTDIGKPHWPSMTAEEFIAMVSSPLFLGDPLVSTQHLMGASTWRKITPDYVIGTHQLRAAHQVYTDATRSEVKLKGHGHATNEHYYMRDAGTGRWLFAGLKPMVRWNEGDFERVFRGSYVGEGEGSLGEEVRWERM